MGSLGGVGGRCGVVEGLYCCCCCGCCCIDSPDEGGGGDVGGRDGDEGGGCCCCCCCCCDQLPGPDDALWSGVGVGEVAGAETAPGVAPEDDEEGKAPDEEDDEVAIQ